MTLTSLLEINKQFLQYEDERALLIAERLWFQKGSPCEPTALGETLEAILCHLSEEGIYYPKILLLRKKQLERGQWKAKHQSAAGKDFDATDGSSCPDCRGRGVCLLPTGAGSFCSCSSGEAFKAGLSKPKP